MVRVVLIDDDPLVRAGLKLMLGGHEGVDFVGEGGDGSALQPGVAGGDPTPQPDLTGDDDYVRLR